MAIAPKLQKVLTDLFVMLWDLGLAILNFILPKRKPGLVVPAGVPGHQGKWPKYIAPREGDSRSACPMLNAMANHGILPRNGRDITFRDLKTTIHQTFNFAPTFCFFVPNFAANFLERSYWRDSFDLAELSKHNAIEHDGSLTRRDSALVPDQGKPDLDLVRELLDGATGRAPDGKRLLTKADLSRALSKRRSAARVENRQYSESLFHNMFGSANSSTMLTIFGGRVDDLTTMLVEERFSENWEPRIMTHFGLTMAEFNATVLPVEFGVHTRMKAQ
ncbi:hypothetical protein Q7P36_008410 [Cladosporium allicinum]